MNTGSKAFTLIESLVAIVIVAVGVVAALGGMSALSRTEVRMQQSERMQRLALDKYEELLATGQAVTSQTGDFQDRGENRYSWSVVVTPTGLQTLEAVTVTVEQAGSNDSQGSSVTGMQFVPPLEGGDVP